MPVSLQLIALLTNGGLAFLKFTVGMQAGSRALIADAFNSAGDVIATFVAWIAFRYGLKPPDKDHPYGHQNAETLAGLLIGAMLCATGIFIGIDSVLGLEGEHPESPPGAMAIWAALFTGAVKTVLYGVSIRAGRASNSPTLLASARDHAADVFSSMVALLGIYLARHGYPIFDSLAGVLIGLYIVYLSMDPLRSNIAILMQQTAPELASRASAIAAKIEGVETVFRVRVQPLGGTYRMDMDIHVSPELRVGDAHEIAHDVEDRVREQMDHVFEVHVHIEPAAQN